MTAPCDTLLKIEATVHKPRPKCQSRVCCYCVVFLSPPPSLTPEGGNVLSCCVSCLSYVSCLSVVCVSAGRVMIIQKGREYLDPM